MHGDGSEVGPVSALLSSSQGRTVWSTSSPWPSPGQLWKVGLFQRGGKAGLWLEAPSCRPPEDAALATPHTLERTRVALVWAAVRDGTDKTQD